MRVLVDVGGSGVRVCGWKKGVLGEIYKYADIDTYGKFCELIHNVAAGDRIDGLAISVPGFVDKNGYVLMSRNAGYLEGNLKHKLKDRFGCKAVYVVNDGEAHTRMLLASEKGVAFGAIHLALGSGVAFGVINEEGKVIKSLCGDNWDIGDYELKTRGEPNSVWYKLGAQGLRELEENLTENPYIHYGTRLGSFLRNMAVIFRPRTIGLSGGIITAHKDDIYKGIKSEFAVPVMCKDIAIKIFTGYRPVMEGLTTLFV